MFKKQIKPTTNSNDSIRTTIVYNIPESGEVDTKAKKTRVKSKKKQSTITKLNVRQQKVIEIIDRQLANGSNVFLSETLREAGYSQAVIRSPGKVFKNKLIQGELKKIGVDSSSRVLAHEYMMNARTKHVMHYDNTYDPLQVIAQHEHEFPGFRCFDYRFIDNQWRFQFSMPNDINMKAALDYSFKHFPVREGDSHEIRKKNTEKRVSKINDLAEKLGLHLKKPIKLGINENSSPS